MFGLVLNLPRGVMHKNFALIQGADLDSTEIIEMIEHLPFGIRRITTGENIVARLVEEMPAVALIDSRINGLGETVEALREEKKLSSLLLIVLVQEPDPEFLVNTFRLGMDDFMVVGHVHQLQSLVAGIEHTDNWNAVRAPAGQVILAHDDRLERVKLARILKRNGYDAYFASTTEEVRAALQRATFRAVISSVGLPGEPLFSAFDRTSLAGKIPPWIVISPSEEIEAHQQSIPASINLYFFESGADPEGITFVLNEILTPPPVGARRSRRILYGTPISSIHKGGENAFYGFTFDINVGGLYIRTLTPFPLQTEITLKFRPPYGRGCVVADAQVVWRKAYGETSGRASPPGMGVQFLNVDIADRAAYEAGYHYLLSQTPDFQSTELPPADPPI
jgi:DNA-binding NarL/FixJ family response regulator